MCGSFILLCVRFCLLMLGAHTFKNKNNDYKTKTIKQVTVLRSMRYKKHNVAVIHFYLFAMVVAMLQCPTPLVY